jgi:hypothetical protein
VIPGGLPTIDPFPVLLTASGTRVKGTPPIDAVTALARVIGMTQEPEPVQAPPHTTGPDGVSVTSTPAPNEATHASPQSTPGTSLVTVPPAVATDIAYTVSGGANVAVTVFGLSMTIEQGPVPVQPADQPANDQPGVGFASSVTVLSVEKDAVHVGPQAMPTGWLVTVPLPLTVTARGNIVGRARPKNAVTPYDLPGASSIGQQPSNPSNSEPGSGVAVSVTGW